MMASISMTIRVALWMRLYLRLLVIFCILTGYQRNEDRLACFITKGSVVEPVIRRRPYLVRFAKSYVGW